MWNRGAGRGKEMRIISQDGAIDVPYENADLERRGKIISVWTGVDI